MLLILESPHTNEYKHKHPVAGKAGILLCREFTERRCLRAFDRSKALGCEIIRHSYPHLGVMNASSVPLDRAFYPDCCSENEQKLVARLDAIKTRLQKSTQKQYTPKTEEEKYLVNAFSNRFDDYFSEKKLDALIIVPCGHIAKNFIQTISVGNAQVISDLDHPSSRNWINSVSTSSLWNKISTEILP